MSPLHCDGLRIENFSDADSIARYHAPCHCYLFAGPLAIAHAFTSCHFLSEICPAPFPAPPLSGRTDRRECNCLRHRRERINTHERRETTNSIRRARDTVSVLAFPAASEGSATRASEGRRVCEHPCSGQAPPPSLRSAAAPRATPLRMRLHRIPCNPDRVRRHGSPRHNRPLEASEALSGG